MARNNTTTTYSAVPNSGTHGAALRAALSAGLSFWSVGAVASFGSGTTLREYFVLSHTSGHEIMIFSCGSAISINTGIYSAYHSGDPYSILTGQVMSMFYARQGGFQASLTAGNDPATQAFWDHITVTNSLPQPSLSYRVVNWDGFVSTSQTLLFTEDDASEFLAVWSRDTSTISNWAGLYIFAFDLMIPTEFTTETQVHTEGMMWFEFANTAKPKATNRVHSVWWKASDNSRQSSTTNFSSTFLQLNNIPGSAFPTSDGVPTVQAALQEPNSFPAFLNPIYIRFSPNNLGLNTIYGNDVNFSFVDGMGRGWALPWDPNEGNPT